MSTVTSIRMCALAGLLNTLPAFAGYEEDIAPLLRDKCNSCHATQAPMLGTYDQVKGSVADIITTISVDPAGPEKNKLMPKNGPKLAQADIDKIKAWQSAGMPQKAGGTPSTTDSGNSGDSGDSSTGSNNPGTQPPPGDGTSTDPGAQPGTNVSPPGTENGQPTPLIVDLTGNGSFAFASRPVFFDIRGTGQRLVSWPSATSALLALDLDKDGRITSGRELFGDGTLLNGSERKAGNGFEALAQYDFNQDGMIDRNDPVFSDLKLWHDRNSNGKTDSGELTAVRDRGILSFNLTYERHVQTLDGGDEIPLLLAWYVDTDKSGTPRNKVLADIFLTDFSQTSTRKVNSR